MMTERAVNITLRISNEHSDIFYSMIDVISKICRWHVKHPAFMLRPANGLGCLAGGGGCAHLCASYLYRMRTGKRNRHRRPDSPDPNPKSKRDDISINQLT
ncbi:hypothetical protein EVAR_13177_1 [Eumeta japonica]|uniref:Uncharacterized protein n=1 Tax=Eumeta variegata TaxID=151549 RepID=A0A4C1TS16_EUMVA|nr:hypothetical protein EVAR_13177_1 [Eumeta japonica]